MHDTWEDLYTGEVFVVAVDNDGMTPALKRRLKQSFDGKTMHACKMIVKSEYKEYQAVISVQPTVFLTRPRYDRQT